MSRHFFFNLLPGMLSKPWSEWQQKTAKSNKNQKFVVSLRYCFTWPVLFMSEHFVAGLLPG
tara:strand:- start:243 stop:425 length:183 start_codon:yes stop_codon:yes gene_type:complete